MKQAASAGIDYDAAQSIHFHVVKPFESCPTAMDQWVGSYVSLTLGTIAQAITVSAFRTSMLCKCPKPEHRVRIKELAMAGNFQVPTMKTVGSTSIAASWDDLIR